MYTYDFKIKQGDVFRQDIYFITKDNKKIPLEGYTAKSQIRPYCNSPELIAEIHCRVHEDDGIVTMRLSSEETNKIKAGIYYYDILLNKNNDNEYFLKGKFIIEKHITEIENE